MIPSPDTMLWSCPAWGIVGIPGNLLAKKYRLSEQETEMVRGGEGTLFDLENFD